MKCKSRMISLPRAKTLFVKFPIAQSGRKTLKEQYIKLPKFCRQFPCISAQSNCIERSSVVFPIENRLSNSSHVTSLVQGRSMTQISTRGGKGTPHPRYYYSFPSPVL